MSSNEPLKGDLKAGGSKYGRAGGIPRHPNQPLGFEIDLLDKEKSFIPEFYPEDFTQMKKKEFNRYGGNCNGESISIKVIKNREFHVTGKLLQSEIPIFQALLDLDNQVDLISPLTPDGGMECFVKKGELGNQSGWDPKRREWKFHYTLDLISTGKDEYDTTDNPIVTAILSEEE